MDFSAIRGSVFDDPGDEKAWHVSQRAENLIQYYEDRGPAWYASAIAPLEGADRVLDLGCGPGLALQALLNQGSSTVLGIDRWPAFVAGSTPEAPILAHDLSLPMPFLESGSFDGVLSHYALDYVSPICSRQVLREAYRVLRPGGRLVVYLAAIGLAGGDESRTISYTPEAFRTLLVESGFDEIEVEGSSDGRNTVARACRPSAASNGMPASPAARIDGDTQLSASFRGAPERLAFALSGPGRDAVFSVDLPAGGGDEPGLAACARAQRLPSGATELQFWIWRGPTVLIAELGRVDFPATEMRIAAPGSQVGHVSAWSPAELSLEPQGNAFVRFRDLPPGDELNDAGRSHEGRQVIVECAGDPPTEVLERLSPGRNRFLVRQASRLALASLDREWLAGRLHGVAVTAVELEGERLRELLLWSGWRQSLLYLGGPDWTSILAAADRRRTEMEAPVVLVDPALDGDGLAQPLDPEAASFVASNDGLLVLLGAESSEASSADDLACVSGRLLLTGPRRVGDAEARDAEEALRHLTERTLLMRLRQARGLTWADVGRRLT